jgi:fructokinase
VRFSPNIHPLAKQNVVADMKSRYGRDVRIANDAACFALSEASDGAAAGAHQVYGIILGTGVGGTLVTDGKLSPGPNAMQEWGHVSLPWQEPTDTPRLCGCGKKGCIESYLSGKALHLRISEKMGRDVPNSELHELIEAQHPAIMPTIDLYLTRLAKACAMLVLIFDPDMLVFGGGLSNLEIIYREVPKRIGNYTVLPDISTKLVKAKHGDDSGMRGAAWLWPEKTA